MSQWTSRPAEERALLNPSFCSCLLWQASVGYEERCPCAAAIRYFLSRAADRPSSRNARVASEGGKDIPCSVD